MTTIPILQDPKIKEFESYYSSFNKHNTVKKILKISAYIFGICAIGCFSSFFILQISSQLLLGSFIASFSVFCLLLLSKNIINYFQSATTKKKPDKISPDEVIKSLDLYNSKFPALDTKTYLGKIEKIDLEKGAKLVLKADLHGDFFSLIEHLKALEKKGILNKNLKITDKYKGKIVLAFLGDYLDRGEYSFEIIDLLIKLKMTNPNEVILIKGNHENLDVSIKFIHPKERHFYENKQLCSKLNSFFSTLSLCAFVGTKNDTDNKYQYACLTHGAIDPDIDPNEVLGMSSKRASMLIRKDKKATLSSRILNILPNHLKNKKLTEIQSSKNALEEFIKNQTPSNLSKIQTSLKITNIDKKKAKQILSILKVQDFLKTPLETFQRPYTIANQIESERLENYTSFNWGDIKENHLGLNKQRGLGLCLTPQFIKDYFTAVSTETRKIKVLRAGHAHSHKVFPINKKQGFIEILPVAGELSGYDNIRKPVDVAEIISIAPKVKQWKEQWLFREKGSTNTTWSPEKAFYFSS